jgi:integral membrane protein (TIGR00529 family)
MGSACSPTGALLGLLVSIVLIIVLLRLRVDLGLSLFAGAALIGLFSGLGAERVFTTLLLACIKVPTVRLVFVIILIMFLAELASHYGYLETFTRALENLISDRRINMCLIPAFGGLLPMPGGAMWSAPLVNSVAGESDISPEERTFINYWFRHVWEYVLPVYPGVVVASAILAFPIERVITAQAPLSAAAIVGGTIVLLLRIKKGSQPQARSKRVLHDFLQLLSGIWPFAFVIVLVVALKADLLIVLVAAIALMWLLKKTNLRDMAKLARRAVSPSTISLVLGVMAFKDIMEVGGVVRVFPGLLGSLRVPDALVLFLVPMLVGLLTGITQAFVGVTFPVVMPFILAARSPASAAALAYAGGFLGVLLSPVHLCLTLTYQYFKARLGGVYYLMIFPSLFVTLVAFLLGMR